MFVPSMTSDELFAEYMKEQCDLLHRVESKVYNSKEYKRLRRASCTNFPVSLFYEVKTQRNNRYIADVIFPDRRSVFADREELSIGKTAIVNTPYGSMLVLLNDKMRMGTYDKVAVTIIQPHALTRYKERMGYTDCDGITLIKKFLKNNINLIVQDGYRGKDNNEIFVSCKDGGLLGELVENENTVLLNLKTFIASDTMQEGYKSEFNDSELYNQASDTLTEQLKKYKPLSKVISTNKR